MAFSWGEILIEIRDQLNSETDPFFKDSELLSIWNHRQLFFARETKFLRKEVDLTISSDGFSFGLPNDFLGIIALALVSAPDSDLTDETVNYLSPLGLNARSADSLMGLGFYRPQRNLLRLNQDQTDTDNPLIRFSYYAKPVPLVDEEDTDQETEVYDEYVDDVIQGVIARSYLKRSENEKYQLQKAVFEEGLARAIKAEGRALGTKKMQVVL